MKTNSRMLMFALTLLMSVLLVSFASAATVGEIKVTSPTSIKHDAGTFTVTLNITNTASTGGDVPVSLKITKGDASIVSQPGNLTFAADENSKTTTATLKLNKAQQSGTVEFEVTAKTTTASFSIAIDNTPTILITPDTQQIGKETKIEVKNTGNMDLSAIQLTSTGATDVTFSEKEFSILKGAASKQITVSLGDASKLKFGTNSILIKAKDSASNAEDSAEVTVSKSFCKNGATGGNLSIENVKIDNSGKDNDVWKPLDIVDIEVRVENDGEDNIDDVVIELGLFDSVGKNQVNDLIFETGNNEEFKIGRIRDGDKETATFSFRVPADFKDGDYKLAVKAYSEDLKESVECTDSSDDLSDNFFESIDVESEDDEGKFIAFDNIQIAPSEATCGDSVTISADVYNVGDDEQDQIKVNLASSELGLRLSREIREDLENGDKAKVSFDFVVPQNLKDKLYRLEFSSEYDYSNGAYKESSDEATPFTMKIIGCSATTTSESIASINAKLDSSAKAGEELIVKATVTNLLPEDTDFVIRPTGFEEWGELKSLSDRLIRLNKGESKEITLNFNVNDDTKGEQTFQLEVIGNGKVEAKQVQVNFEEASASSGFDFGLKGSNLIWVIGAINVILIVLIIVVAVRLSRK